MRADPPRLRAGLAVSTSLGLDDVGLFGVQQTAAGASSASSERPARQAGGTSAVVMVSSPSQKPMLRRAVQYCTCGCDSKSLVAKLSCAKALTSGSTPV